MLNLPLCILATVEKRASLVHAFGCMLMRSSQPANAIDTPSKSSRCQLQATTTMPMPTSTLPTLALQDCPQIQTLHNELVVDSSFPNDWVVLGTAKQVSTALNSQSLNFVIQNPMSNHCLPETSNNLCQISCTAS